MDFCYRLEVCSHLLSQYVQDNIKTAMYSTNSAVPYTDSCTIREKQSERSSEPTSEESESPRSPLRWIWELLELFWERGTSSRMVAFGHWGRSLKQASECRLILAEFLPFFQPNSSAECRLTTPTILALTALIICPGLLVPILTDTRNKISNKSNIWHPQISLNDLHYL